MHALGSETSWIDDVPAALRWQSAALGTGLFDGVHLDVEPWLHADWGGAGQPAMLDRYLDLLDRLRRPRRCGWRPTSRSGSTR